MSCVKRDFKYRRESKGKKSMATTTDVPPGVPRVAKLMALAIRFDELIRTGAVRDQAELARLGRVSRARLTQIARLLFLAPDIQEDILFLSAAKRGRARVTERQLRPIVAMVDWREQREMWAAGWSERMG
jgi:hypothetical protein